MAVKPSLALIFLCSTLSAQQRVLLDYRFERVETARYRVVSQQSQSLSFPGESPAALPLSSESHFEFLVVERYQPSPAGARVDVGLEHIAGRVESEGSLLLRYDSSDSLATGTLAERFAPMLAARAHYDIDPRGNLAEFSVEGFDAALAEQLRFKWPRLPADSIAVGEGWRESFELVMPNLPGSVEVQIAWSLESLEAAGPAGPMAVLLGSARLAASDDADFALQGDGELRCELMVHGGWIRGLTSEMRSELSTLDVVQRSAQTTAQTLLELVMTPESDD